VACPLGFTGVAHRKRTIRIASGFAVSRAEPPAALGLLRVKETMRSRCYSITITLLREGRKPTHWPSLQPSSLCFVEKEWSDLVLANEAIKGNRKDKGPYHYDTAPSYQSEMIVASTNRHHCAAS
jgi:hypothetical protein